MIPCLTTWASTEDTNGYSSHDMALPDIAKEIADHYKIETPLHNDEGNFPFTFNENLTLELFSIDKENVGILAKLGDPKELSQDPQNFLKNVLQWNFARQQEQQEILTWDPKQNQIILFLRIPIITLSTKSIIENIEQFLSTLDFWVTTINQDPSSSIFSPI